MSGRRSPCPICGKPSATPAHPFCSLRCKDLDLGRWLGERYRIAGETVARSENEADGDER